MKIIIGKHFEFEASHKLPDKNIYGKCKNQHGHTYKLTVEFSGEVTNDGWVCNFSELKEAVNKVVIERYDHANLNDYFDLPTAENILKRIYSDLEKAIQGKPYKLHSLTLYETSNSYAKITS